MNSVGSDQVGRPVSARAVRPSAAKYLFFAAFGVMGLFVLCNNPIRWHLLPLGLGGATALVFGATSLDARGGLESPEVPVARLTQDHLVVSRSR
jgi:hypothetical protein